MSSLASTTFAIAELPTPIFNTKESPFSSKGLSLDSQGRIMALETIAFPGTKFFVEKDLGAGTWQVKTDEYVSNNPLYVDSRFLKVTIEEPKERLKKLPNVDTICERMKQLLGLRYFWGGNWPKGIVEMQKLYPHLEPNDPDAICRGVDCSGLLYWATEGVTPRNTSGLAQLGQEIDIGALSEEETQKIAQPLDMIVWRGHVVIVLNEQTTIESRIGRGVVLSDFVPRLQEAREMTKEQNKQLYYRRWI